MRKEPVARVDKRQVFDLPSITMQVTEHEAECKCEGFAAAGVPPGYCGNLIHDFWEPCDTLDGCIHSRCNAHLLRELISFSEDRQHWAEGLVTALLAMKQAADEARQRERSRIAPATLNPLVADYDGWIAGSNGDSQ